MQKQIGRFDTAHGKIGVTMERQPTSRTRMGNLNEGKQKCLQIPAPNPCKFTVSSLWNLETPS
ncbi:hypothetical protein PRtIB026_A05280 [Pseudomonas sp. RtIB026]|nr:hypothetical protein PRtIB026_A05280 [Pseudomonas sp. RtIB026]